MELLLALAVGTLAGTGVYLALRARSFDLILGLTLLSYAVNLFIFLMGGISIGAAPILHAGAAPTLDHYADPLPQALVLTAIVIGFAMTALLLVIALRTYAQTGSDHVDGGEPPVVPLEELAAESPEPLTPEPAAPARAEPPSAGSPA